MNKQNLSPTPTVIPHAVHPWLLVKNVTYVPGKTTSLLDEFAEGLLHAFRTHGHPTPSSPEKDTDIIFTTAAFGEPMNWRECLSVLARRKFDLDRSPIIYTLVQATPEQFQGLFDHLTQALQKPVPDPRDFDYPGLSSQAYETLYEQGHRGGPILSVLRLIQSQAMCIRNILVIGYDHPQAAYIFDLVGAHPRLDASDKEAFYTEIMYRIVTSTSTTAITEHQVVGNPVPSTIWKSLSTPAAMCRAGRELGKRSFFTEMVRVTNLVNVPAVNEAIASQYSEGCFATWEPRVDALIATVTGSSRPVDKDKITENDLAVIVGVRPDGKGALVRHIEGHPNDPPSSEAVELIEMDAPLPRIQLEAEWGIAAPVPVIRSKLHGHRGVSAYDPRLVEHVWLDPAYYYYPVSCATGAQAQGIRLAFSRSESLLNPSDPRLLVFTVLPGHGLVMVEKWVPGKEPFQLLWEYMDAGYLDVDTIVPQGPFTFQEDPSGKMLLRE